MKSTRPSPFLTLWRPTFRRVGVHRGLLALGLFMSVSAAAATGLYHQCPGNLITNQLSASQATAQGCHRVQADGLSLVTREAEVHAPAAGKASAVNAPGAGEVPTARSPARRWREPVSRVVQSHARSTARYQKQKQPSPTPSATDHTQAAQLPDPSYNVSQRQRDRDALAILQGELQRTLLAQQSLRARDGSPTYQVDMHRLRVDETALRREIERITR